MKQVLIKPVLIKSVLLFVFLMAATVKSMACTCAFQDAPLDKAVSDAVRKASVVVLAKALSIDKHPLADENGRGVDAQQPKRTHFSTVKTWKGKHKRAFSTEINTTCCMCGYSFEAGEIYLLYLFGPNKHGFYKTDTCSRTKKLTRGAKQEMSILDDIANGIR